MKRQNAALLTGGGSEHAPAFEIAQALVSKPTMTDKGCAFRWREGRFHSRDSLSFTPLARGLSVREAQIIRQRLR